MTASTVHEGARRSPGPVLRSSWRPVLMWITIAVLAALLLAAPLLPLQDPARQFLGGALASPSPDHWLGTDELGRDSFARLVQGARTTFAAAATAVTITMLIGLPLGLIAGYFRRWIDAVLSRVADAVMAVPPLILLLAAIAAIGPGITKSMIVLGVVLAPRLFRVVRGSTIALTGSGFLEVGRMSGCPARRMLVRYILPNIRAQVIVQFSLLFGYAVLTEAGISFLGLGVQAPEASLGVLLKNSIEFLEVAPLLTIAPGVVITGLILACNLLGDRYATRKEQQW